MHNKFDSIIKDKTYESSINISLISFYENTKCSKKYINLINLKEQGEISQIIRDDISIYKKLIKSSWIFNYLGFNVYFLCSDIKINNITNIPYFESTFYKFNDNYINCGIIGGKIWNHLNENTNLPFNNVQFFVKK